MPIIIADHQLRNFDDWFALFTANPPPPVGNWRLLRGADDPNRVYVIGEVAGSEVDQVKAFMDSERMQGVFRQVNDMSDRPIAFIWVDEVAPG
jgi:hypothetical protein